MEIQLSQRTTSFLSFFKIMFIFLLLLQKHIIYLSQQQQQQQRHEKRNTYSTKKHYNYSYRGF